MLGKFRVFMVHFFVSSVREKRRCKLHNRKCLPLTLRTAAGLQVKINLNLNENEILKHTHYRNEGRISFEFYYLFCEHQVGIFRRSIKNTFLDDMYYSRSAPDHSQC